MPTYTAITDNGLSFNVKAQTLDQASMKAYCFLLDYPTLSKTKNVEVHTSISKHFDRTRPFITMTIAAFACRYVSNRNTNKKSVAKLLALV